MTMVRLTPRRRAVLVETLPDAANLALAALVFGQALAAQPYSYALAATGIGWWLAAVAISMWLAEEHK